MVNFTTTSCISFYSHIIYKATPIDQQFDGPLQILIISKVQSVFA